MYKIFFLLIIQTYKYKNKVYCFFFLTKIFRFAKTLLLFFSTFVLASMYMKILKINIKIKTKKQKN